MIPRPVTAPSTPMPRPPGASTSRPAAVKGPTPVNAALLGGAINCSRPTVLRPTPEDAASGAPISPATEALPAPVSLASRGASGAATDAASTPELAVEAATSEEGSPGGPAPRPADKLSIPKAAAPAGAKAGRAAARNATPESGPRRAPTYSRPATPEATPDLCPPAGPNSLDRAATVPSTTPADRSSRPANSRPAIMNAAPEVDARDGTKTAGRRVRLDTRTANAAGAQPLDHPTADHAPTPDEPAPSGPGPNHKPAGRRDTRDTRTTPAAGTDPAIRRASSDARGGSAGGGQTPGPAVIEASTPAPSTLLDPALALAADVVDDLERVRIANENRLRQLTRTGVDKDGEERGFGLDPDHPDVIRLGLIILALENAEREAVKNLERKMKAHPLGGWVESTRGVGLKQGARLLAAVGDPYIRPEYETQEGMLVPAGPRTVSQLWAYAGLHTLPADDRDAIDTRLPYVVGGESSGGDPGHTSTDTRVAGARVAARRRKGEKANWSPTAKMRAYLIAESCLKQRDPDCRDGHIVSDTRTRDAVPAPDSRARRNPHDTRAKVAGSAPLTEEAIERLAAEAEAGYPVERMRPRSKTPQPNGGHRDADTRTTSPAVGCGCSPYRVIYDERRERTAESNPDWNDGHSHQDALRVASKYMLRDLYRAAEAWHQRQRESEATP